MICTLPQIEYWSPPKTNLLGLQWISIVEHCLLFRCNCHIIISQCVTISVSGATSWSLQLSSWQEGDDVLCVALSLLPVMTHLTL